MQLRMEKARTTKDVDLAVRDSELFSDDVLKQSRAIFERAQVCADLDLGDYFVFILTGPTKDLMGGGIRIHVEARVDDRSFEKFHLDIGIDKACIEPLEYLESMDLFDFAGFKTKKFPAISKEQQFAEKIHAYTQPRPEGRENSRVKDLVDMILFINEGSLNEAKLKIAIVETFASRSIQISASTVAPPPESWKDTFLKMSRELDLNEDLASAYKKLADFMSKIQS